MQNQRIIILIITLFLCSGCFIVNAQNIEKGVLSANKQFEFATILFNKQQYQSSIIEFQRFLVMYPDDKRNISAHYQIGLALQLQKKYLVAIDHYQQMLTQHSMNKTVVKAGYRLSECYQAEHNFQMAISTLQMLNQLIVDQHDKDDISYQMGWLFIETKQFTSAKNCFYEVKNQSTYPIDEIISTLEERKNLSRKKPYIAGVLSIVPGLGQIYCGRYRDALLSMIVNGIIGWAAWESFDNEQPAQGTLFTFFGFGFYSGNIYGAASSAIKFNRRTYENWFRRFKNQYKPPNDNFEGASIQ